MRFLAKLLRRAPFDVATARDVAAMIRGEERESDHQLAKFRQMVARWDERVEQARAAGHDELIRTAVRYQQESQKDLRYLEAYHQEHHRLLTDLEAKIRQQEHQDAADVGEG